MFLSASEGLHWRYEVCEHSDGYLVQMRDLDTGELDEEFATVFRTMPVAFACGRLRPLRVRRDRARGRRRDRARAPGQRRNFISLSDQLRDIGVNGRAI